jgi:hypothetical protein
MEAVRKLEVSRKLECLNKMSSKDFNLLYSISCELQERFTHNEKFYYDKIGIKNDIEFFYKTFLNRKMKIPEIVFYPCYNELLNDVVFDFDNNIKNLPSDIHHNSMCFVKYVNKIRNNWWYLNEEESLLPKPLLFYINTSVSQVYKMIPCSFSVTDGVCKYYSLHNVCYLPYFNMIDRTVHSFHYNYFKTHFSYNICDPNLLMFYEFLVRKNVITEDWFKHFHKIMVNCLFFPHIYNNTVHVVEPPLFVLTNRSNKLHSIEGPAVKFRDGKCHYFINGRSVPKWIFEEKDRITREKFLNEKNAETRAAIYTVLGHKKMMEMLGTETVHTSEIRHANGDVETVELIKTGGKFQEIGNRPFAWVKVTCPSTGTDYLLAVEPKYENAAEALASLSMFDSGEYSFNFRT